MQMVFMTPLTQAAWFFDEVVPRHLDSIVYGDIEENCKLHGTRGQLEHETLRAWFERWTRKKWKRVHMQSDVSSRIGVKNFEPAVLF